jgi:hypothetical protein
MAVTNVNAILRTIDFTKPGSYYISVEVNDKGEVTYATANSNTYQNLLMEEEQKAEVKMQELVEGLNLKMKEQKDGYETKIKEQENLITALKSADPVKDKKIEMSYDTGMTPLKARVLEMKRERGIN